MFNGFEIIWNIFFTMLPGLRLVFIATLIGKTLGKLVFSFIQINDCL